MIQQMLQINHLLGKTECNLNFWSNLIFPAAYQSLMSEGRLCILQGLFSDIQNLSTVYRKELQLMSMWCHDVVMLYRDGYLGPDVVMLWIRVSETPVISD